MSLVHIENSMGLIHIVGSMSLVLIEFTMESSTHSRQSYINFF